MTGAAGWYWCVGHRAYHWADKFGSNARMDSGLDYYCRDWRRAVSRRYREKRRGLFYSAKSA